MKAVHYNFPIINVEKTNPIKKKRKEDCINCTKSFVMKKEVPTSSRLDRSDAYLRFKKLTLFVKLLLKLEKDRVPAGGSCDGRYQSRVRILTVGVLSEKSFRAPRFDKEIMSVEIHEFFIRRDCSVFLLCVSSRLKRLLKCAPIDLFCMIVVYCLLQAK